MKIFQYRKISCCDGWQAGRCDEQHNFPLSWQRCDVFFYHHLKNNRRSNRLSSCRAWSRPDDVVYFYHMYLTECFSKKIPSRKTPKLSIQIMIFCVNLKKQRKNSGSLPSFFVFHIHSICYDDVYVEKIYTTKDLQQFTAYRRKLCNTLLHIHMQIKPTKL